MDGFTLPPPPVGAPGAAPQPASTTSQPASPPPGFQAGYGAQQQQQPQNQNPVGRPAADPERQAERLEQSATVSRMLKNLPKAATDPRIAVYKLKGRFGRHAEPRAVLNILMSDVEDAAENDVSPEDYIQERIESDLDPGRYLCVPQDNHGNRIKKAAQWEVSTMNGRSFDDEEEEPGNDDETVIPGMGSIPGMDMPGYGYPSPYGQRPPPTPNIYPDSDAVDQLRDIMREQRTKEDSSSNMMMVMMQQQQMNEARLREERELRERERREEERKWREDQRLAEERREERERSARNDRLQLLATIAPVFAPLLQKLMDGKEDKITPLLLTKLMESDNNRNSATEMISMMSEASKQQVLLQGEMSRQNMSQQSEANKMMMQHVLTMAQDTIKAQRSLEDSDGDDPLSKFGKVISTIAPMLQGAQSYSGAPAGYQQQQQQQQQPQLPQQPPAQQPQQPPAERSTIQPPQRQQPAQADIPDEQYIYGALDTIRRLETGDIPAEKRPDALAWCAQNLPQEVQQAVLSDDEETVLARSASIVMGDANLKAWISDEDDGELHQAFLRGCLNDIKQILSGHLTEERAAEMVREQKNYQEQKNPPEAPPKQPPPEAPEGLAASEEEFDDSRIEDDPYGESSEAGKLYEAKADETGLSDDEEDVDAEEPAKDA